MPHRACAHNAAFTANELPHPTRNFPLRIEHHSSGQHFPALVNHQLKPNAATFTGAWAFFLVGFAVLLKLNHGTHGHIQSQGGSEQKMRVKSPKGIGGRWKTGQRVPAAGMYVDQFGVPYHFELGATFPPISIGRKRLGGLFLAIENLKRHSTAS